MAIRFDFLLAIRNYITQNDEYNITIELIIDNSLNYGINQRTIVKDIHSILKYETAGNLIKIYVTEELCNYFNYQDNSREKHLLIIY